MSAESCEAAAVTRVLLIEDDASVREAAAMVLERAGIQMEAVADGVEGLYRITSEPTYDLVLLDLMLPTMSGFDVCRAVRSFSGVPIVMLTARSDSVDVVRGLELGADDYITKPFVPSELVARIRAVLRRSIGGDDTELRPSDLRIDEQAFRAFRGDEEPHLTTIEFRLLVELVGNAGNVLTRELLLDRVWGYDYLGDSRLVDTAMKRLRDKLGPAPQPPEYISTVRGVGYRFERG